MGAASQNIFLDSNHLDSTIVVFQSDADISTASVTSNCAMKSKFLTSFKGLSFFEVDYSEAKDCKNGSIVLQMQGKKIPNSLTTLNLTSQFQEYMLYLDYPSSSLKQLFENLEKQQKKYAIYKNYKGQDIARYFHFLQGQRKFYEVVEQKNLIERIITARNEKYTSPVPEKRVVEKFTKIPNSGRPYRAGYTDGIHHGWDIDAPI